MERGSLERQTTKFLCPYYDVASVSLRTLTVDIEINDNIRLLAVARSTAGGTTTMLSTSPSGPTSKIGQGRCMVLSCTTRGPHRARRTGQKDMPCRPKLNDFHRFA